jgi:8-oxo-dGTP pyrophosphatase MutT (NUDIX family)
VSDERAAFELVDGETVYEGLFFDVRVERFRHADGEVVSRELVRHQGAVGMLAYDEHHVWLVRQPREAAGVADLLEIPAGRLDVEGEEPLAAAQRELAEELGLGAREWEALMSFYPSAGFSDEQLHLFAARDLYESHAESEENERIEIVRWPLGDIDGAIAQCKDSKTLIALYWLARRVNVPLQAQGAQATEAKPAT